MRIVKNTDKGQVSPHWIHLIKAIFHQDINLYIALLSIDDLMRDISLILKNLTIEKH